MAWYPSYIPDDAVSDIFDEIRDQQTTVDEQYERYVSALDADDLDGAVSAKRDYQLAAYHLRQSESEFVWIALGHALEGVADQFDPADEAVRERGRNFTAWVTAASQLRTVQSVDQIERILVRRSPTLPENHSEYVKTMFGLSDADIEQARRRDQRMLQQAGWQRRGRPTTEPVVRRDCPVCGETVVVRGPNPAAITLRGEFLDNDDVTREICPHCDGDVYVSRPEN